MRKQGLLLWKHCTSRYCDLSPVQLKLYEQFSGSNARKEKSSLINVDVIPNAGEEASSSPKASAHVFQALQYLLKLCSHPLLVLRKRPPDSLLSVLSELKPDGADIVSTFMSYTTLPNWSLFKRY
ncbi:TATA-binding protein-associated factor BTAF1 isoform X1 [Cinnamomum micranthum f. kanehirae]|uniref:TATA-binding protein-associated factor BTAF1 isoform X1 n=1 Tax=Cinnamomum micranthum f. kanehirae TaxID=337451 RepID=A0A443PBX4_9MAGN|nr:TATA-binding protein-associated factor BTAF1 isoform X1 [Cinnamomum micranthum f. kanehirae]